MHCFARGSMFLLLLVAVAGTASAGLLGANINVCWNTVYYGTVTTDTAQCDAATAGFTVTSATVIDPGVEFATSAGSRLVDFNDTSVTVRYTAYSGSPSPDLFIFTNLPGPVTGLTLLTSNPLSVTTAFTGSSIALLIGAPECCADSTAEVTYQVDFSAVPEPASYFVTGLGLAALAFARRRSWMRR
jgi:hypothetical protein